MRYWENRFTIYVIAAMLLIAGLIMWQLHNIPESYYAIQQDLRARGLK